MRIVDNNIGHIKIFSRRGNYNIIEFIGYPLERRRNKSMQFVLHDATNL